MTTGSNKDAAATILKTLGRHRQHLVEYGQRMHTLYPASKIAPEVLQAITVPVALPIAMLLYGLACSMLAPEPEEPKEVSQ